MKDYEDRKYEAWKEQVEANLLIYLKKNLLTKPSTSSATTHRSAADEGASSEDVSGSLAAALQSQGKMCMVLLHATAVLLCKVFVMHCIDLHTRCYCAPHV